MGALGKISGTVVTHRFTGWDLDVDGEFKDDTGLIERRGRFSIEFADELEHGEYEGSIDFKCEVEIPYVEVTITEETDKHSMWAGAVPKNAEWPRLRVIKKPPYGSKAIWP